MLSASFAEKSQLAHHIQPLVASIFFAAEQLDPPPPTPTPSCRNGFEGAAGLTLPHSVPGRNALAMDDAEAVEALGRAGCVTAEQLVLRPEAKHTGLAPAHRIFGRALCFFSNFRWKKEIL